VDDYQAKAAWANASRNIQLASLMRWLAEDLNTVYF
jgi:hypothetical protein